MAKKNRPKKSKALVVWAIVTVIVLLADCVGNYLVVGLPGNMNSLLDKPMAAIGEAIDFKLSAGELGGLMDTLFGSQRPIYSDEVTSVYPTSQLEAGRRRLCAAEERERCAAHEQGREDFRVQQEQCEPVLWRFRFGRLRYEQ